MNTQEKTKRDNNILLANFQGLPLYKPTGIENAIEHGYGALYVINKDKPNWYCSYAEDLKYSESIDALLPVWEKIESLGYAAIVQPDAVRIINYNSDDKSYMGGKFICMGSRLTIDQTLIGAFNMCFLQFIHFYNQKQTENATD